MYDVGPYLGFRQHFPHNYVNIGIVHACTSNDVARTLMCLVNVRLKSGYTKHLDVALRPGMRPSNHVAA